MENPSFRDLSWPNFPNEVFDFITYTTYTQADSLCCLRPYHVENTGSRPITEVKQRRAWLVLGWVTAWEHHVL